LQDSLPTPEQLEMEMEAVVQAIEAKSPTVDDSSGKEWFWTTTWQFRLRR